MGCGVADGRVVIDWNHRDGAENRVVFHDYEKVTDAHMSALCAASHVSQAAFEAEADQVFGDWYTLRPQVQKTALREAFRHLP